MEVGVVLLKNTKEYPFNDSARLVMLKTERETTDYPVFTEILDGTENVGQVVASGKARNGFCLAYTGSAAQARIGYCIPDGEYEDKL